ncbi:MAG TPA: FAD-binding oxidoreductase, partial [Thermomicrobiales bacterium]|nr:FAD-binding oxidoreductase [Thermomicrobiales bacterium]
APADEEGVAAVLGFADREGLKILVRGCGTQLGLGLPPTGGDILLDLGALDRVEEHNPGDLTVSVQAGLPLASLQERLATAGQWLALDPALPAAATVGGVVATNASGPRRLRYGGVRDQIIGVRVVRADGTIAKGGGKVVKNVAGFDLPKLFTGSLGTLGVIVSANFRLYPLPPASRTVVVNMPDPAPLCDLALRVTASTLIPAALDVAGPADGGCALAARFETIAEAAEEQARALLDLAGPLAAAARTLTGDAEAAYWARAASDFLPGSAEDTAAASLLLKASVLPTGVAGWLAALADIAAGASLAARWRAHAGHGLVTARLSGAADALAEAVAPLRRAALDRQGSLVVADAPPALARRVDVWGPSPALDLMRRVKAAFDPNNTLNPGRFVGGI